MPTLTSSQGTLNAQATPNDTLTIAVTSGAYTLEYPPGTVLAAGATTGATYTLGAGTYRLQTTGSITYTLNANPDSGNAAVTYDTGSGNLYANGSPVSGAGNPNYLFYIPGRQQSGAPTDFSGQGRNAIRDTALTEAQCWATLGYMSTTATNDSGIGVADPVAAINFATDVLIVSHRVKMAPPGANAAYAGCGANPTPHGVYFSARTSGKVAIIMTSAAGVYAPGEVIPGVVFDNTEHAIGLIIDGPNKRVWAYIDGGLAWSDLAVAPLSTISSAPAGWGFGQSTYQTGNGNTSVVSTTREWHVLKCTSVPLNADEVMLKMATQSGRLTANDLRFA